jgi:hypothetical protein
VNASNVDARVQHATARLLEMWSSGDLPAAVAKVFIRRQAGERPSDRWSIGNRLLCLLAGTDDARGFRQWQEVGRHVLKGSKAVWILGPVTRKVRDAEAPTDPGRSNLSTVVVGFRGISVFRLEDTEGDPVAVPDYTPPVLPPLAEVAEAWGVRVRYGPGQEGSRFWGYYAPGGEICLLTHAEKVFFHELAHAAHDRITPLRGGQDARQEIVAETVAAVLCMLYGFEGYVAEAREYVAHYTKETPGGAARGVMRHLAEIGQVLELIVGAARDLARSSTSPAA